jgi:hypothetical protein
MDIYRHGPILVFQCDEKSCTPPAACDPLPTCLHYQQYWKIKKENRQGYFFVRMHPSKVQDDYFYNVLDLLDTPNGVPRYAYKLHDKVHGDKAGDGVFLPQSDFGQIGQIECSSLTTGCTYMLQLKTSKKIAKELWGKDTQGYVNVYVEYLSFEELGYDIELMNRYAKHIGKEICNFVNCPSE